MKIIIADILDIIAGVSLFKRNPPTTELEELKRVGDCISENQEI